MPYLFPSGHWDDFATWDDALFWSDIGLITPPTRTVTVADSELRAFSVIAEVRLMTVIPETRTLTIAAED
jgi:hypothetical protein